MSRFTQITPLNITPHGWIRWKVIPPPMRWHYLGRDWETPNDFITDGKSNKRFLWWWSPPWDGWSDAAVVVHDCYYRLHAATGWLIGGRREVSRREADRAMLYCSKDAIDDLHKAGRINRRRKLTLVIEARVNYFAVRRFGGSAWRNNG